MTGTGSKLTQTYRDLLDFVYPPLCLGCGGPVEAEAPICEDCLKKIDKYERPLCLTCGEVVYSGQRCQICNENEFLLYSYGDYREPMAEIIKQFKFKGISYPARFFSELIIERLGHQIESLDADFLVPIPLHQAREYARGFNQAKIIAERLAEGLHLKVNDGLLIRTKKNKPQAKLEHRLREKNISDVFMLIEPCLTTTRLILVDDVVTTGSTIKEARSILQAGGYTVPAAIAIAK